MKKLQLRVREGVEYVKQAARLFFVGLAAVGILMVALGFYAPEEGMYTFSTTRMDAKAYIYDAKTGKTYDLSDGEFTFNGTGNLNIQDGNSSRYHRLDIPQSVGFG